ncbi:MAG: RICIN domain-containing protein [Actinobacteria bacterium]|nr:RICIN domain-containing protein [Actinomycetota bacterium]
MGDQIIPDGTYTVTPRALGADGQLTMGGEVRLIPADGTAYQQWKVACTSGAYTLRNVATDLYLGTYGDPNAPPVALDP